MPVDTAEFTSGDIAAAVKETAPVVASPATTDPVKTDPAPAAAIEQPVKTEVKPTEPGPIPFADHDRVVKGFYRELDSFAWAKDLKPSQVREAMDLAEKYRKAEADRVKAEALGTAPQADLRAEDGTKLYSESQNLAAIKHAVNEAMAALREEFGSRVQPFETEHAERERINGHVSAIQEAMTWRGFDEHMPVVTQAIADANAKGQTLSVRDAYILHVVPLLTDHSDAAIAEKKKAWLAELNNTSAVVRDGVNPARSVSGTRIPDKDLPFRVLIDEETEKSRKRA